MLTYSICKIICDTKEGTPLPTLIKLNFKMAVIISIALYIIFGIIYFGTLRLSSVYFGIFLTAKHDTYIRRIYSKNMHNTRQIAEL